MGKPKNVYKGPPRVAVAKARHIRISPTKANFVIGMIRGQGDQRALNMLRMTDRKAGRLIEKVLQAAINNAEKNAGLAVDDLVVSRAFVDKGVTMKRWRAGSMGRGMPIKKKTSHITIEVNQA
jgi:large subunit ribosomal protein L22